MYPPGSFPIFFSNPAPLINLWNALASLTDDITKITIEGITDNQANIAGTGVEDDASGLSDLKTLTSTSDTADAIDALYDRVSGSVSISGGDISVLNAVNISSFTVGEQDNAITYSISDGAGDADNVGVATNTAAVNRAIAEAQEVTVTESLTVAEAKEMLEDVDGNPLATLSKFQLVSAF